MKMIQENHFEGGSRLEAMKYICEMHNIVNKRLKKPIVPCDQIEKMWGQKGCSSCDPMSILKKYQAKLKAEAAAKQTSPAVQSLAAGSLSEATEKVLKISSIHAEQAMLS